MTTIWEVCSLDVTGDEAIGWEFNDVYRVGEIELTDWNDDGLTLAQLADDGYINALLADEAHLHIDGDESYATVIENETGRPILVLQYKSGLRGL